jgi:hypothetical protein
MTGTPRQFPRYAVEIAAELDLDGDVRVAATQNLSQGGAAVVIDRTMRDGAEVSVRLFLTQDGIEDPDEEPFATKARVQWVRPLGQRFLAGVQFDEPSAAAAAHLERFLKAIS